MNVMNLKLLKALRELIPLAQHADYPEGDHPAVQKAKSLIDVVQAWERTTGWLIERRGLDGRPQWRRMAHGNPVWTTDSLLAIRFARREDAEMFAAEDEDAWMVTEHSWEGPSSPPSADGNGR